MKKIVALSLNGEIKKYFSSLENNYICEVIPFNYEESHVFEKLLSDDEALIILSIQSWSIFKSFLDSNRMQINGTIVLAGSESQLKSEELRDLCKIDRLIKGVINTSLDIETNYPWFNLLVNPQFSSAIDDEELEEVGDNIERIVTTALNELERLKQIHENLVPIREEKFKGLAVTSKFGAGESAGGEFFDVLSNDQEALMLVARSRSYLVSSMIMGQFDELRSLSNFDSESINNYIVKLQSEITNSKIKEEKRKLDVLFVRINLKTMKGKVWKSGDSVLVNNGKVIDSDEFSMNRGEKLMVMSSGLLENDPGKSEILSTAIEKMAKSPRDLLNEVFYTLKNDKKGMFFSNDATMLVFEVDKNAILQI
jgi:hypothetical protein